jgi:hypothetical protein
MLVKNKPIIICYEEFNKYRTDYIKRICNFINVEYKQKYSILGSEKIGTFTTKYNIHKDDININKKYLNYYFELLKRFSIEYSFNSEDIFNKYEVINKPKIFPKVYGLHTRAIIREYESIIAEKNQRIYELEDLIKKKRYRE